MNTFDYALKLFKRLSSRTIIDPVRDWLILLILSSIAFVSIIVWNVSVFNTAISGVASNSPASGTVSTSNNPSIDAVRSLFTSRAAEESKYVTGSYRFSDPSQL